MEPKASLLNIYKESIFSDSYYCILIQTVNLKTVLTFFLQLSIDIVIFDIVLALLFDLLVIIAFIVVLIVHL